MLTLGTLVVAALAMEFARQAARHNRRSADAAELADRPHLIPKDFTLSDPAEPDLNGELDFMYRFYNYGTGPGWIKRLALAYEIDSEIPAAPGSLTYVKQNAAVAPKDGWGLVEPMKLNLPKEQLSRIVDGSLHLVLFGALEYIGSGGRKHVHKFVQEYLPQHKRLHPIESPFWEYT